MPKNSGTTGNLGAGHFSPGAFKKKPFTRETFMRDLKKVAVKGSGTPKERSGA